MVLILKNFIAWINRLSLLCYIDSSDIYLFIQFSKTDSSKICLIRQFAKANLYNILQKYSGTKMNPLTSSNE